MNFADFQEALQRRADLLGVALAPESLESLFRYFELLRRWNAKINLTALPLDNPTPETLDRLLLQPLQVAAKLPDRPLCWFDLGSGGGSPAIPIKLVRPQLSLTMVESRARKAAFLQEALRALGLVGRVENVRFEELIHRGDLSGVADLITVRAVKIDEKFLQFCAYLLKDRGLFVPMGFEGPAPYGFISDPQSGFLYRHCST